ncbi:unnamed protein product [Toxocara canis]|uniref:Col_cuticle_N domain-containing protein n=1 Tax=Toxocara canis TaxID=6265 RepID=A0A183UDD9_TOXCA|nr:unnamed protein product [Toxocara canis]
MNDVKVLVYSATFCSCIATLACVLMVPSLYSTISDVHDEVIQQVGAFRVDTDTAWSHMMDIQVVLTEPSKPRENPFSSVFRKKRHEFAGLPAFCQCEPIKPQCPLGPAGERGEPGPDGRK